MQCSAECFDEDIKNSDVFAVQIDYVLRDIR